MASLRVLYKSKSGKSALIAVNAEMDAHGMRPKEKKGFVRINESFKYEVGEEFVNDSVSYAKVEIVESQSVEGGIFNWLVW